MNRFPLTLSIVLLSLSVLWAPVRAAHNNEPDVEPFRFEHFFQGPIHARGFVRNRGGEVIRRFWAEIVGTWDAGTRELTLDEILHFDDGEVLERVWQIERLANGEYRGRAGDVEGVATGEVSGPDGVLRYALTVQYRGMDLVLNVLDRFHAVSEDVMYNNTQLRKFGFNVGSVSSVFYKGAAIPPDVQSPNTTAAVSD
ncbi:MAG: DUF3833 family protein [Pseudomonadota bacterium]